MRKDRFILQFKTYYLSVQLEERFDKFIGSIQSSSTIKLMFD